MTVKQRVVPYHVSSMVDPSEYDRVIAARLAARVQEMLAELVAAGYGHFDWTTLQVEVGHPKGGSHVGRGFTGYVVRLSVDEVQPT